MGATVTVGKKAHAYLSNEGIPVFILEEQTYEKNCYPHTPKWSVVAFGTYQDVMRHVFRYASATDGGMLQGRSGWIGSEGYIKGWRDAIANADLDKNHEEPALVNLYIGTSWTAPIEKDIGGQWSNEAKAIKLLRDARFDWIADDLLAGKSIPLNMKDDLNVLLTLYGSGSSTNLGAWHILRDLYPHSSHISANRKFDLKIPAPLSKKPDIPKIEFFDIDDGVGGYFKARLVLEDGKLIKRYSSDYQYLQYFISDDLAGLEEEFPGCAEHFIRQYKAYIKGVKRLPGDTKLSITYKQNLVDKWKSNHSMNLANAFNNGQEGTFVISVDEVNRAKLISDLSELEANELQFSAPALNQQEDLVLA
ncbi:hypothetical protein ICN48_06190 [Polynucleobacter sp. JS-Safj-400b-B2]|uniref:hypothetical protein n=1 Tax=Polynucleobacter sp. JS-Safj-400b-B2 TaxID=2576921 RepID=UPI001C0ABE63|nr:hypothetical protein [Polynucleobacter sp. JS-Safj-400b-B2]MBU3625821.1 hypothetical protein [Polynucleobacter sp. JS-Safj-400b-B2]